MFGRGIRLPVRLLGIPVILDWSFLLILPLIAWGIGRNVPFWADQMGIENRPDLERGLVPYLLGFTAALGLFASVVLHELGHSVVARWYGVQVRSITLWFLGGVAQFEEMPRQRGAEAVVAIIGPLVSVAVGVLCLVPAMAIGPAWPATQFILIELGTLNIALAVFNLIPALPLDGGRVLRSLLALRLPRHRATQIAGGVSKGLAIVMGLYGLLNPAHFFLIFVALFVYMAGQAETQSSQVEEMLRDMPVRELMNPDVRTVPTDMTAAQLTQTMLRERHLGFPVVQDGIVRGFVSVADVEGRDPGTLVGQMMKTQVATIAWDADATDAFRLMARDDMGKLVVVDGQRRMVGIITKTDLMHAIRLRTLSREMPVAVSSPTRDAPPAGPLPEPRWG